MMSQNGAQDGPAPTQVGHPVEPSSNKSGSYVSVDGVEDAAPPGKHEPAHKDSDDEQAVPRFMGYPLKWIALVSLTFQTSTQVFVIKYARAEGTGYLNSTAVFGAELTKIVLSVLLLAHERNSLTEALLEIRDMSTKEPLETLKLGVPALAYAIQNNLLFLSLDHLGMAVQQVTYQLKILTAALLSVTMLGKTVGCKKWISLFVLVIGVVLVQFQGIQSQLGNAPTSATAKPLLGLGAVVSACFVSGFAGAFMEKVLKGGSASVWLRNVQLAFFGSISAGIAVAVQDTPAIIEKGLLQGWTLRTFIVVITVATGGLMAAAVLKYADNIARQFSTALSITITSVLSMVVLNDVVLDWSFAAGGMLTVGATFMYNGLLDDIFSVCNL